MTEAEQSDAPPPKRRWLQFSLRTLMIVVTIAAAITGWFVYRDREQRRAAQIKELKQQKLKVAAEWWQLFQERDKIGIADAEEGIKAVIALKDAQIDLAENKNERLSALKDYRDRMKAIFEIEGMRKGQKGYSLSVHSQARIGCLEAEAKLKEEGAE